MTIIITLAVLALVLGLLEVYVVPGFGITGICAIICAVVDLVLILNDYGFGWAFAALVVALIILGAMLYIVSHSRTLDEMSLHATISSTNATEAQLSVTVGSEGKALTRLALVGNAEIDGKIVEVKSSGAFIEPGMPVRVTMVNEATVVVEQIS